MLLLGAALLLFIGKILKFVLVIVLIFLAIDALIYFLGGKSRSRKAPGTFRIILFVIILYFFLKLIL